MFFVNQDTNGSLDTEVFLGRGSTGIPFIAFAGSATAELVFGNNSNFIRVLRRNILIDTSTGDPIPELILNNQTGKITVTELFKGSLNVNVNIAVIDSLDLGIIESGGNEDLAELGGKRTIHDLDLIVSDGLIVLETSNPQHVNETNATTINIESGNTEASIDIFNQTSNKAFNNYWTQTRTQDQIDAGMNFIPKEDAGLFLYSKAADTFVSDGTRTGPVSYTHLTLPTKA